MWIGDEVERKWKGEGEGKPEPEYEKKNLFSVKEKQQQNNNKVQNSIREQGRELASPAGKKTVLFPSVLIQYLQ